MNQDGKAASMARYPTANRPKGAKVGRSVTHYRVTATKGQTANSVVSVAGVDQIRRVCLRCKAR
jgi:hypothetical protein